MEQAHESSLPANGKGNGTSNRQKQLKMFLLGIGTLLVLVMVGVGTVGYAQVRKGSLGKLALITAKVLHLPVVKVNGRSIRYSDYAEDMQAIRKMQAYDAQNGGAGANLTPDQMSDQVLWRLTNNVLLEEAAATRHVKFEQKDVDDLKQKLVARFANEAAANAEVQKRYGWTLQEYEQRVMRPFVLQTKLTESFNADKDAVAALRTKAEGVLEELKKSGDFAKLAAQYGEDGTAKSGGDLGWFGRGVMVPRFEEAVFALKDNQLSPTLVETEFGYHIIQRMGHRTTAGKEEVQARHILFRFPSIDVFLDSLAHKADIKLLVGVHDPFAAFKTAPVAEAGK